jgi:uncharacterized delta-60 repeat protein
MLPYLKPFLLKVFTTVFIFGFLFALNPSAQAAAGDPDTSFIATLGNGLGEVNPIAVQPDGKIILGGKFYSAGKYPRISLARVNADGTTDTTFNPPALDDYPNGSLYTNQLAVQTDGKILVSGEFFFQGQKRGLIRLNADGSPDNAFNNNPTFSTIIRGYDIVLQPDGKIIFAGAKSTEFRGSVWRLSPGGSTEIERTLINIVKIAPAPDGKFVAFGNNGEVLRLNADLSTDSTFQPTNGGFSFRDVAAQPDGKVIVVGTFSSIFGFPMSNIARFNADGTFDASFAATTGQPNSEVRVVKALPDGRLLIGGKFTAVSNVSTNMVAILNADGSLDASFRSQIPIVANGTNGINDVMMQADGKVLAERYRLNTDGSVDFTYAPQIRDRGLGYKVLVQPDNKILVGGQFSSANEKSIASVARFNADGSVDNTFSHNVFASIGIPIIRSLALQADGKILVGGGTRVLRLTSTGALDTTFHIFTADAYDIKPLPDGKTLVAGDGGGGYVRRMNADGTLDATFNATVNAGVVYKMALQSDGRIIIAGDTNTKVKRLNADGTLDPTFNVGTGANNFIRDIALQADGKLLIGGDFTGVNFDLTKKYLARLNSDGSLDATFTPPALEMLVRTIRIQPDGKILAGGISNVSNGTGTLPGKIVRVNQDGTFDAAFNNATSANNAIQSIDLQSDNKIIIGGWFTKVNDVPNIGVARLLQAPAAVPFDFDGDGKADIAVFRPSTGAWYIARPNGIPSQNFDTVQFGASGDVIVPADYDGDGKTDVAVWRPSDGTWYLLQSSAGFRAAQFGANGDIPVPGDFDGDGKANLAVFRPATGSWYIARATGTPNQNFDSVPFGANGDKPIAGADFDGDGKDDVAVFRPSTGDWYRLNSSNGQFVGVHFGTAEDKPVAADYDGDGKTDLAVFRPSDGVWYRINSGTDSFTAGQFGVAEDRPAPADYDGDGRADLAVFRPSSGTWYLLRSTAGFTGVQFGANGDLPAANAFVR